MTHVHLCQCNYCDSLLIDENAQTGAKLYPLENYPNALDMVRVSAEIGDPLTEYWACPVCLTDRGLKDLGCEEGQEPICPGIDNVIVEGKGISFSDSQIPLAKCLQFQINSAIGVCEGRIVGGMSIENAFATLYAEIDNILKGEILYKP